MKKNTKLFVFLAAAVVNILYLLLCGYGSVHQPDTAGYLDPFFGIVAVAVLAYGETVAGVQVYIRIRNRQFCCRTFGKKFWLQCIALLAYYFGSLFYLATAITIYKASYLSIFAMVLCPLWMTGGSCTLWTGEEGEGICYLDESAKWYKVSNVAENDDVVEITCKAPGDRERTITIAKKKQKPDL